eukprot:11170915-Lingulodinium_polyedra.AAC.1
MTSNASKSECEDSRTLGGQYLQLRIGFRGGMFRSHRFPASEAQDVYYVTRPVVWQRRQLHI